MLFHNPDRTFKRLSGCYKRAITLGKQGEISSLHPLATAWSNCKLMLDAKTVVANDELIQDISLLDWFASRVEIFSETAILTGDETLAAILFEWEERMFFNPCLIRN